MKLLSILQDEATRRGLLEPGHAVDAGAAFALVRDMPYRRASDRKPETILREWQGTCSGKHYLLASLFKELGLHAQVMACTRTSPVAPEGIPAEQRALYEAANRRFVDVHNYILLSLPGGGQMIVDATWPLSARGKHVVNEQFILGVDQQIASSPLQSWPVPEGDNPQTFKNELLRSNFTPAELEFRELIIQSLFDKG